MLISGGVELNADSFGPQEVAASIEQEYGQEVLERKIQDLWAKVSVMVRKILEGDKRLGYGRLAEDLDPSLDSIMLDVNVMDAFLKTVMESKFFPTSPETKITILNCMQCAWAIRLLHAALGTKDEEQYKAVMRALDKQSLC